MIRSGSAPENSRLSHLNTRSKHTISVRRRNYSSRKPEPHKTREVRDHNEEKINNKTNAGAGRPKTELKKDKRKRGRECTGGGGAEVTGWVTLDHACDFLCLPPPPACRNAAIPTTQLNCKQQSVAEMGTVSIRAGKSPPLLLFCCAWGECRQGTNKIDTHSSPLRQCVMRG